MLGLEKRKLGGRCLSQLEIGQSVELEGEGRGGPQLSVDECQGIKLGSLEVAQVPPRAETRSSLRAARA